MTSALAQALPGNDAKNLLFSWSSTNECADQLEEFSIDHMVIFAEQNQFPPEAVAAMRRGRVTGKAVLRGWCRCLNHGDLTDGSLKGIDESDLIDLGLTSKILRHSILDAFADLVKEKGWLRLLTLFVPT
jgi:hypothetical protein